MTTAVRSGKPIWKHRRVDRAAFLRQVHGRLTGEAGRCIPILKANKTGFWAVARMLLPVVEAVSNVIYRNSRGGAKPATLLTRLAVPFPHLVWQMYRHTLMHNDALAAASYRGRVVRWSVSFGGGHRHIPGIIHVDLEQLFDDLLVLLTSEIEAARRKPSIVWVPDSFRLHKRTSRATRKELSQLGVRQ